MKRTATASTDPRILLLLERIATGIEGLRQDLGSALADLAASSVHGDVDDDDDRRNDARDPAQLLTAAELAALLQIDERTLRELRHAGKVPEPLSVGKRLRWRRRDVEAWMAKRKAG